MNSNTVQTVYWRHPCTDRASALQLLAELRRLPLRPRVAADLANLRQPVLYVEDGVNSYYVRRTMQEAGAQQIQVDDLNLQPGAVWVTGDLLGRLLANATDEADRPRGGSGRTWPERDWQPAGRVGGVRLRRCPNPALWW